MSYILSIDQGTTSTRAILFDAQSNIKSISQVELTLHYPHNGWVEQNAEDIWRDTQKVCRDVAASVDINDIAVIGITNQRETTVVWNRLTGKPVYNAIVWQDRRTAARCAVLKQDGVEEIVSAKTGLLLDPYFSATKLEWILDNVDGARASAEAGDLLFGTIDCYLLWHLTGGKSHMTDVTNASRTMLYNIRTQAWDDDLLTLFNIPRNMLPEVRDNSSDFGQTDLLGKPLTIGGMAGDQLAALIGQACFKPGMVKSTYGTGCFVLMHIGDAFKPSKNRLLTTVAYRLNGKISYALEGSIFVAGAAIQWLRDGLGIISTAAETEALAQSVQDNNGVYLVPAFTGLGAPYWNPEARAAITGLTRGATRAHIVRAALEAQAFQTEDLMRVMAKDAGTLLSEIRVDGGMVRNNMICQMIADITDTAVLRPVCVETTALGAAYLAGLQAGIYASVDDIAAHWSREAGFTPAMSDDTRRSLYQGWQTAVGQVLHGTKQ